MLGVLPVFLDTKKPLPKKRLILNGRGSRTRTYECWIQNPVPYQLGDTPKYSRAVNKEYYMTFTFLCQEKFILFFRYSAAANLSALLPQILRTYLPWKKADCQRNLCRQTKDLDVEIPQ